MGGLQLPVREREESQRETARETEWGRGTHLPGPKQVDFCFGLTLRIIVRPLVHHAKDPRARQGEISKMKRESVSKHLSFVRAGELKVQSRGRGPRAAVVSEEGFKMP
jgi:Na+/phosphate symporter